MSAAKREPAWRWPRSTAAAGRYAPRLWPVPVVLVLAVVGAGAAGYGIYALLRHVADPKETVLGVVRGAIGVAAFFGAVLAGVYAYRKQEPQVPAHRQHDHLARDRKPANAEREGTGTTVRRVSRMRPKPAEATSLGPCNRPPQLGQRGRVRRPAPP